MKSVLGVIPARYASTRFPGKPLATIAGISLVERVWRQCAGAAQLSDVVVATEDERIMAHVAGFGGRAVMTSSEHQSGTDRLGEVATQLRHDYYVNIQGDEPLVSPAAIDSLVAATVQRGAPMSTLVTPLQAEDRDQAQDPNVVKVVLDDAGNALYFSRSAIPYDRDGVGRGWLKHIGIYMYSRDTLQRICALPPNPLERRESLEQLRALADGIRIYCVECEYDAVSVDVPGDIAKVEALLGTQPG